MTLEPARLLGSIASDNDESNGASAAHTLLRCGAGTHQGTLGHVGQGMQFERQRRRGNLRRFVSGAAGGDEENMGMEMGGRP